MSRTDPGAARGNQTYPVLGQCSCGHGEAWHEFRTGNPRGVCSVATGAGHCPCRRFTAVEATPLGADEAWADELFRQRDAALEALQRVRELHTDSPAGVCPSCGDVNAQTMGTGDGLVNYPCPTIRALDGEVRTDGS